MLTRSALQTSLNPDSLLRKARQARLSVRSARRSGAQPVPEQIAKSNSALDLISKFVSSVKTQKRREEFNLFAFLLSEFKQKLMPVLVGSGFVEQPRFFVGAFYQADVFLDSFVQSFFRIL
ncbi:MAG: hypothetical protein JWN60_2839 [Acidobacteria bacterium]|nr:hypothetical protein [Acidobacteriota bacterium]